MILSNMHGGHMTQFENQGFLRFTPQQWRVERGRFDSSIEFSVFEVVQKYRTAYSRRTYIIYILHVRGLSHM